MPMRSEALIVFLWALTTAHRDDHVVVVFDALSLNEDVVLFATSFPLGMRGFDVITDGPFAKEEAPSKAKHTRLQDLTAKLTCLFDGRIETTVQHVIYQTARCEHPPEQDRASLIGKSVTLKADDIVTNSTAVYKAVPEDEQTPLLSQSTPGRTARKKYTLCACLSLWNRADFLHEWLIYFTNLAGVEKLFLYDNLSDDGLKELVDWLKLGYNIDYHLWPQQYTQEAFNSHCNLRARRQCEWVTR